MTYYQFCYAMIAVFTVTLAMLWIFRVFSVFLTRGC